MSEIDDLFARYREQSGNLTIENSPEDGADTPQSLGEVASRGFDVGVEGIRSEIDYFKGLFNTAIGDDEAAAVNIATARQREERMADAYGDLETFEEFTQNPTFYGFATQVVKNTAQMSPYVLGTIGSGMGGAAVTGIVKFGGTQLSKQVTKRLVKDAFEKKMKGETTDALEDRILDVSYRLAQRKNPTRNLTLKGGAKTGMFGQEYVSMAGSNFGENLDFLDADEAALRAGGLAVPQAFIGLKGEELLTKTLLKDLGELAAKRSTKEGSTFANYAKAAAGRFVRGGAAEGVAEVGQEGISVANRFTVDDEYTRQDALLRLGESAFAGFFGGGSMATAGSAAVGSVRKAGDIMGQAKDFIEKARQQQVDNQIDQEQMGGPMGFSNPEPQSEINAQLRAALDEKSARHSVWIEGANPEYDASADTTKKVDIQGETFYTRFIPGRGTIISKNFDVAEEVAKSEASEAALVEALGYSDTKPADGDVAIEVLDRGGNVIWQQGVNEEGVAGAMAAAEKQIPEGGSVRRISIKEALENRKRKFEEEQGPQVRNIDDDGFDDGENRDGTEEEVDFFQGRSEMPAPQEQNIGRQESYKPRDPNQTFDTTQQARKDFAKEFADLDQEELGKGAYDAVDFGEGSEFATMSDGFLRAAVEAKKDAGNNSVFFKKNDDGSWSLMQTVSPEADRYGFDSRADVLADPEMEAEIDTETARATGQDRVDSRRGSPITFIKSAIKKAKESRYARQRKRKGSWVNKNPDEIVTVNGEPVNLADLVKEGQRKFSIEENTDFQEGGASTAQRNGAFEILSSLIEQGYEVRIGNIEVRSQLLKDITELSQLIEAEDKAIRDAALDFDLDLDDPQLRGRLDELLKAFDEATADVTNKDRGTFDVDPKKKKKKTDRDTKPVSLDVDKEARRNSPLSRLVRERAAWAKEYAKFMDGKRDKAPEKPEIVALIDTVAGFQDGKPITLGKILNTTPIEPSPKDRMYSLYNEDGFEVFRGNKQQVQERIEEDGQDYRIGRGEQGLTDEEFARERNVGMNERTEVDQLKNDNVPLQDRIDADSERDSAQFSKDTSDADPDYKFEPQTFNQGGLKQIGMKAGSLGERVANIARRTLGLKKPISVIDINELLDADDFNAYFDDPRVAEYVKDVVDELKSKSDGGGRYIGFNDAHIVLVDPTAAKNDLDAALIVAHEIGHALYKEQLSETLMNPGLYNRLFDEFQKARDAKDAPTAYQGNRGFEEWYSDQVATWAVKQYAADAKKGLVGSHFIRIVRKLKQFHKQFSTEMKKRFGKDVYSVEFDGYMDEVLKTSKAGSTASGARNATMQEKIIVRKMAEAIEKKQPGVANAVTRQVQKMIRSDKFTPVYNFIFTADSRLRKVGGDKLADLFYARAQQGKGKGRNKLGYIKTSMLEANAWYGELEKMIDGKLDSPEVQESIALAFSDTPTRDLRDKNAIAVREWFDRFYDEYIEPSNTDVGRQRDYAPVVLKLSEVEGNPEGLIKALVEANPDANEKSIRTAVGRLVNYQQAVLDGKPIDIKETDPAASAEKALILTKNLGRDKLAELGYLEDPDIALLRYTTNMVKRVEWNKNTKDDFGNSIYEEELKKLSPKAQEEAKAIVHKYLGYQTKSLDPRLRWLNSWGSVLQIIAILPLATLGSLPELAGPVIASKEFSAVSTAMSEIVKTVRNRNEARALARDLGVVTSQSVANVMMSQSELDYMNENARKIADGFFRFTLLDTYTKFTREFASNMGVKFLQKHSDPELSNAFSKRYLSELGVTAEDVKAWTDSGQDFSTPEGQRVRKALQRFVESSTLRPNAAERPLWASDPHYALFWQLKGFVYSYGKVMLAGAKRESAERLKGATAKDVNTYAALASSAGVFALMGVATMPLAMVGMELREYAKYGLAWAIPGIDHEAKNYFRTDGMSTSQYLGAAFDRAYAFGPMTIASQALQSMDWGRGPIGAAATVAGPTAETVTRLFQDGVSSTFTNRILPTGIL